MPQLDQTTGHESLLRLLLIADSKAGKTPWAAQAAMTHNVLYLDGDVGIQSLMAYLPQEAKSRVYYLGVGDYVNDGQYVTRFADFFKEFCSTGKLTWNDSKGAVFSSANYDQELKNIEGEQVQVVGGDDVWQIFPSKLDSSTFVIIDSWTALTQSILEWRAQADGVDTGDIEKVDRGIYAGIGNKATQFLLLIKSLPCHVIVIAHPDEYIKYENPAGQIAKNIKELDRRVVFTKMVPKSTSRPHSMTMAKFFSDVGWLDVKPNGETEINFIPSGERISGGHLKTKDLATKITPADLIRSIGGHVPPDPKNIPTPWLEKFPAGSFVPAGRKAAPALGSKPANQMPTTGTPAATGGGISGLAAMLNKQKG